MKNLLVLMLLACGAVNIAQAEGAKRIVKWVDSQGVTHYGDKMPAQEAGKSNSVMNQQGIVVKKNVTGAPKNEQADAEKAAQQRKDSVLMASYTKPEEIDAARDRYLQMDQAAIQSLTAQKQNSENRLTRSLKSSVEMTAAKKPVPAYLTQEIKTAKAEVADYDKKIATHKQNMDATNKKFADEKARFIELKQPVTTAATTTATPAAPVAPAQTVAAPAPAAKP